MMRNAHDSAAQSEPEYGASPEAAVLGNHLGAAGRARARPAGFARYSRIKGALCANLGGTAKQLRPKAG